MHIICERLTMPTPTQTPTPLTQNEGAYSESHTKNAII